MWICVEKRQAEWIQYQAWHRSKVARKLRARIVAVARELSRTEGIIYIRKGFAKVSHPFRVGRDGQQIIIAAVEAKSLIADKEESLVSDDPATETTAKGVRFKGAPGNVLGVIKKGISIECFIAEPVMSCTVIVVAAALRREDYGPLRSAIFCRIVIGDRPYLLQSVLIRQHRRFVPSRSLYADTVENNVIRKSGAAINPDSGSLTPAINADPERAGGLGVIEQPARDDPRLQRGVRESVVGNIGKCLDGPLTDDALNRRITGLQRNRIGGNGHNLLCRSDLQSDFNLDRLGRGYGHAFCAVFGEA